MNQEDFLAIQSIFLYMPNTYTSTFIIINLIHISLISHKELFNPLSEYSDSFLDFHNLTELFVYYWAFQYYSLQKK
ncbi:hypothetical protein BDB01DRAFT_774056 [Pilobolus umbonatus]|nr:hypothetical protein BDB01DRAFT_774056 [Pilobolus umbonatus]